jgi:hypothetical protein
LFDVVVQFSLTCSVFVNGHVGEVKIGDLGLSAFIAAEKAESVIGTPEYMAPELYEESYTEKVDIYAFGMCLLEMVSMDYPYSECKGPAQIMKKAINNEKPAAFHKLVDSDVKDVVAQCLKREPERPSAEELQQHQLFRDWTSDDGTRSNLSLIKGTAESAEENPSLEFAASDPLAVGDKMIAYSETLNRDVYVAMEGHSTDATDVSNEPGVVVEHTNEGPAFRIGITIPIQGLGVKLIEFTIAPSDDPRVLAEEMVSEFNFDPEMVPELTHEIEIQVSSLQELRERDQQHLHRSPAVPANSGAEAHEESSEVRISESVARNDGLRPLVMEAQLLRDIPEKPSFKSAASSSTQATQQDVSLKRHQEELPTQQPPFSEVSSKTTPSLYREQQVQSLPPLEGKNLGLPPHPNAAGEPSNFRAVEATPSSIAAPSGTPSSQTNQNASGVAQGQPDEPRSIVRVSQGISEEHGNDSYALAHPEGTQALDHVSNVSAGTFKKQNARGNGQDDLAVQEPDMSIAAMTAVKRDKSHAHVLSAQQQGLQQPVFQNEPHASNINQASSKDLPDSNSARAVSSPHSVGPSHVVTTVARTIPPSIPPSDSGNKVRPPSYDSKGHASSSEGSVVPLSENVIPQTSPYDLRPRNPLEQYNQASQISTPAQSTGLDNEPRRRAVDVTITAEQTQPSPQHLPAPSIASYSQPNVARDSMQMQPTAFAALPPPLPQEAGFAVAASPSQGSMSMQDTSNTQVSLLPMPHGTHAHMVRPIVIVGGDKLQATKRLPAAVLPRSEGNQNTGMQVGSGGHATSPHLVGAAALADAHGAYQSGSSAEFPNHTIPSERPVPAGSARVESGDVSRLPESSHLRETVDLTFESALANSKERQGLEVDVSRAGLAEHAVTNSGIPVVSGTASHGGIVAPSPVSLQENINTRSNSQRSLYSDDSTSQASAMVSPAQPPSLPASSPIQSENEAEQQRFYLLCLELMDNVAKGRVAVVKQKLSQGASVTFADYDKRAPLHLAALYGDTAVCKILLEHGADVNALDRWNRTPLQDARIHSHDEVVDILLKAGARDNEDAEDLSGIKMLQACANGQLDTVRELIASNTPVTYKDYEGRTALHVACSNGHADIVDLLMLNGANAVAADGRNRTPLDNAVRNGHRHVLEVLKRNGVEITVQAPVLEKKLASVSPRPSVRSVWGQSGGVHFDPKLSRAPPEGMLNGNEHAVTFSMRPKSTPPPDHLAEELDSMKSAVAISHSVSMGNIVIGSDGFALPTGAVTSLGRDGLSGSSDSLSHSHLSSQSLPASRFDASDLDGDVSVGEEKERLIAEWQERRKRLDEEVQLKLEKLQPPLKVETPSDHEWQEQRQRLDEEVQMKLALLQPPGGDTTSSSVGADLLQTDSASSSGRSRVHDISHPVGVSSSATLGFSSPEGLAALLPERDHYAGTDLKNNASPLEPSETSSGVVILPASSERDHSGFPDPVYSSEGSQVNENSSDSTLDRTALSRPLSPQHASVPSDLNHVADKTTSRNVVGKAHTPALASLNQGGFSRDTEEAHDQTDPRKIARGREPNVPANTGMKAVDPEVKRPEE